MVVLFLTSSGSFPLWLCQLTFPPTVRQGSVISTSLPRLVVSCLFENSNSNKCEVTLHYGFDLYFLDDSWIWAPFHVPVSQLYVFFRKMSVQVLYPFFNQIFIFLLLNFMSSLYIMDSLSDRWFANIVSNSAGCFFFFLI